MAHPFLGLAIGPLAAPIAFWILALAHAHALGRTDDLFNPREMMFIAIITLPWSYGFTWTWGALVIFGLRVMGHLRFAYVLLAGAAGGAAFGVFVMKTQSGDMFRIWLPWWAGAIVGASVAGTCWLAGRGRRT